MRINQKLKVRKIVNESVVLMPTDASDKSTRILSLNSTSAYLWENLFEKEFTVGDAADLLCEKYDVDRETAFADAAKWIGQLDEFGALE